MFAGLDNALLYAAYKLTAQFRSRHDGAPRSKPGTGFFVNRHGLIYLVTNRHMVDAVYGEQSGKYAGFELEALAIGGFLAPSGDRRAMPTNRFAAVIALDQTKRLFPRDYHEDVVCFPQPKAVLHSGEEVRIDYSLAASDFADDTWINGKLSVCDFVAFPGFPPWHDQKDMRPILRTGTIASDPRSDYSDASTSKGRRIAYEAFSFGGSSGSPVFATEKGLRASAPLQVQGFREFKVVGINAGHLEGRYQTHSGVSYFIKSSAILDLIADAA